MEIYKVKNYKKFASELATKTGCDIQIQLMKETNHVHYQLSKVGISLGVLCVDDGKVSFAPFVTLETAKNEQYIDARYIPLFDDFTKLLNVLKDMIIED